MIRKRIDVLLEAGVQDPEKVLEKIGALRKKRASIPTAHCMEKKIATLRDLGLDPASVINASPRILLYRLSELKRKVRYISRAIGKAWVDHREVVENNPRIIQYGLHWMFFAARIILLLEDGDVKFIRPLMLLRPAAVAAAFVRLENLRGADLCKAASELDAFRYVPEIHPSAGHETKKKKALLAYRRYAKRTSAARPR